MNTDKLNDTIKARRLGGASFRQIAKQLRLSVGSIAGRCHRMGLGQPPEKLREKSKALDERILTMALAGARNSDIAKELGLPITTISSRTGRMEIPDRRRKSPERTTVRIRRPEPRVVEKAPEPIAAPDPATAVEFIRAEGCRYALWSDDETDLNRKRVCGGAITRGSYCSFHGALVYVAPERRAALWRAERWFDAKQRQSGTFANGQAG